jgi:hypothetical protein
VKSYRCTSCGRNRPASKFARWGLVAGFLARVCGAHSCCADCLDGITRYPAFKPYPVAVVEDQTLGGRRGPGWRPAV